MELTTFPEAKDVARAAAERIVRRLRNKPSLLLCASAGGTPTATYAQLAEIRGREPQIFEELQVIQIDEWGGLAADSPATCAADLEQKLLRPLHVAEDRYCGFRSHAADRNAECRRVASFLAERGPIDICILGLGLNGHIAMNEPAEWLEPGVHVSELTSSSQQHGMLAGLENKPDYGLTLGMADILHSREILLLVTGTSKQAILKKLMQPRVTPQLPASFLWLHGNASILCDRQAAKEFQLNTTREPSGLLEPPE